MPITITHAKSNTIADWSGIVTVGNSTGGTTTDQASNLVRPVDWNSAHQATLALTGSEIASLFSFNNGLSSSTGAGGISVGINSVGFFEPFAAPSAGSSLSAPGIGTWYFDPVFLPVALNSGQINVLMAAPAGFLHGHVYSAASTGSVSRYHTHMNRIALYRQGTGASTTQLESIWSADCSFMATWDRRISTANTSSGTIHNGLTVSFPAQFDASGGVTYSSTAQSGTTAMTTSTMASTRANDLITGAGAYLSGSRMDIFAFNTSLPAGNYWLAHMVSSSTSSSGTPGGLSTAMTAIPPQSRMFRLDLNNQAYKRLGQSTLNSTTLVALFYGTLATTTSAPTSVVGTVNMRVNAGNGRMYWNYVQTSY